MPEPAMTHPAAAPQPNTKLARPHPGTDKGSRKKSAVLLDTQLSSSLIPSDSTRHSVTSRIGRNSRLLCDLIFSTRHLNATLVKRTFVEKFNTCLRFFAASDSLSESKIAPRDARNELRRDRSNTFSRVLLSTRKTLGLQTLGSSARRGDAALLWLRQRHRVHLECAGVFVLHRGILHVIQFPLHHPRHALRCRHARRARVYFLQRRQHHCIHIAAAESDD